MAKKSPAKKTPKAKKAAPAKKAAASASVVADPAPATSKPAAAAAAPAAPVQVPAPADVSARAHQIWIARGRPLPGTPLADWLQAERELGAHKS